MKIKLYFLASFLVIFMLNLMDANSKKYKVFISSNSLNPSGIYGSNGLNPSGFEFAFNSFHKSNVINSSYPIVSPTGDKFARFEENSTGMYLIIRKTDDGSLLNEIKITGYNPQWFPDGNNLFFETRLSSNQTECWKINVETGAYSKIGELTKQYYPSSDPKLGAAILSADGRDIAYIRLSDTLSFLTPYIFEISTGREKYAYEPEKDGMLDGEIKRKIRIANGPSAPQTIRHMSFNSSTQKLAIYGTVSWANYYDPKDTAKFIRESIQGIFVINLITKEITTIYKTENFFVEHPDVFFFSPNGKKLVFNAIIGNQNYVWFANTDLPNSARAVYQGTIICGETSKQYWALSPWSSSGKKILYSNNINNKDIISSTPCGDEIQITEFKKQVFIQDAQWADFTVESTPEIGFTYVDPVPELLENDKITKDIGLIHSSKHYVNSVAADGVAKIVIRIESGFSNPVKIKFSLEKNKCAINTTGNENEDGSLSLPGDTTDRGFSTVETMTYDYNGTQSTAIVYNAPLDFVRTGTDDDQKSFRYIEVSMIIDDNVYQLPILIFRPPVFLIHGLWSSPEIFDEFEPFNVDIYDVNSLFSVFRADYSKRNNKYIDEILGRFDHGVVDQLYETIDYYKNKMFMKTACAKADVVAHSLGGLIARSMPVRAESKFFRKENYQKGMIHKLITIDTPHLGSGYADALITLYDKSLEPGAKGYYYTGVLNAFEKILYAWGAVNPLPISGGAIHDLRTNSEILKLLNDSDFVKIQPPLHTIVGLASFEQVTANQVYVFYLTSFMGKGLGGYPVLFGSSRHDLIVSEESQKGLFDVNLDRMTIKSGITHSSDYFLSNSAVGKNSGNANNVINMLNVPRNSKYFTLNGRQFGKINIKYDDHDILKSSPEKKVILQAEGKKGIKITMPSQNSKYFCGDVFKLKVEPLTGFNIIRLYAAGFKSFYFDSIPPFEFDITIPKDFPIGKTEFVVVGEDDKGNLANDLDSNDFSDILELDISSNAFLDSIKILKVRNFSFRINQIIPKLIISGFYSDGIRRNITNDLKTTYLSLNNDIAEIQSGEIILKSTGFTKIIVTNSGKSDTIELEVKPDNKPPVADAGNNITVKLNNNVTLDGSNSFDPDGSSLSYFWNLYEKPKNSSLNISGMNKKTFNFTPDIPGYYVFKLTVMDDKNESSDDYVSIHAETTNDVRFNYSEGNKTSIISNYFQQSDIIDIQMKNCFIGKNKIYIVNIIGKKVSDIFNGFVSEDNFSITFNAQDIVPGCFFIICENEKDINVSKIIKPY